MKNNITELVFILDRSGSMAGFEADTIGGFNAIIEKQKKQDGKVYVSTVLFDNESKVIHDRVDISEIKPMTCEEYQVGGCWMLSVEQFIISETCINTHAQRMSLNIQYLS